MPDNSRIVLPGKAEREVMTEAGETLAPPADWVLLPPGDAALTRRVKQAGPTWQVRVKRGRRVFSGGVWAPAATIERIREQLADQRATPAYKRRLEADRARRQAREDAYAREFYRSVLGFLDFHPRFSDLAARMARAVTDHAVPVGSGTVARTGRIPIDDRAAAAVIAWMRHRTTGYDTMKIPRIKGRRREVRQQLAQVSQRLLGRYRAGEPVDPASCPIRAALSRS